MFPKRVTIFNLVNELQVNVYFTNRDFIFSNDCNTY